MADGAEYIGIIIGATEYLYEEALADPELSKKINQVRDKFSKPEYLYIPSDKLKQRVRDYHNWYEKHKFKDRRAKARDAGNAGKLMEEVALLAFTSLVGYDKLLSYQSYADQFDLVISGTNGQWKAIMRWLRLDDWPFIVVEAKNTDAKVDVAVFTRLCSIVQNNFESDCCLGVFFTRTGATGFPESGSDLRSLRDALARQVIFHAKTGKHVVVLTHADIDLLLEPGGLLYVLRDKIEAIKTQTGSDFTMPTTWQHIELPPHLKQHIT